MKYSAWQVRTAAWFGALSAVTVVALIVSSTRTSKAERGNEASAIAALRAVNSAQEAFASSCGGGGYVTDLADLMKKPRSSSQGFISPDLSHNGIVTSGYIITLARDAVPGATQLSSTACVELSSPLVSSYFVSAVPLKPGETGTRFFATDAHRTIYQSTSGPIANPIPAAATPVQ